MYSIDHVSWKGGCVMRIDLKSILDIAQKAVAVLTVIADAGEKIIALFVPES